MGCLASPVAVE